jgi:YYY domain-containing protein
MIFPFLSKLWILFLAAGLAGFPLARRVFLRSPGCAYAAAKLLGLLPGFFLLWLAILLGPGRISPAWCGGTFLLGAAALWARELRGGTLRETWLAFRARGNLAVEALLLALLAFFLWGLTFNPAVDPDSERFMDYALLEAVTTDPGFPPQDPWFAGEPIHYYYFGYYGVGYVLALTGTGTLEGFVPAIALAYALLGLLVFAFGRALLGCWSHGLLALFLVLFAGNLRSFLLLVGRGTFADYDWFGVTRVIPGTINEFPYFSFLWGDLHPYVIAFPLLGLLFLLLLEVHRRGFPSFGDPLFVVTALTLGLAACVNTWDYPVAAFLLLAVLYRYEVAEGGKRGKAALTATRLAASAAVLGAVPFLPYLARFQAGGRKIALVTQETAWSEHLLVHGVHWIVLAVFLVILLARTRWLRKRLWLVLFLVLVQVLLLPRSLLPGLLEVAAAAWILAEPRDLDETSRFGLTLAACGLLLAAAVEVFYVDDLFGGDIERIVTVFKIYLHTWLLLALASAALLVSLRSRHRRIGAALVGLAVVLGLAYPVAGTIARVRSLGAAHRYSTREHLIRDLGYEHGIIEWLEENARPGEVVLEAPGGPYTWNGRVAAFTPLSAPLAWDAHEATWRNSWEAIMTRRAEVDRLFETTDREETEHLLEKYDVRYVVAGKLEAEVYPEEGLKKFRRWGEIVYSRPGVELIRLRAR